MLMDSKSIDGELLEYAWNMYEICVEYARNTAMNKGCVSCA